MNQQLNLDPKTQFKGIQILHLSLLLGSGLIFLMLWFANAPAINMGFSGGLFLYLTPTLAMAAIALSLFIYNKKKVEASKLNGLNEKLAHYRQWNLARWALTEWAALFSILTFFFLENNIIIALAAAFCLFVLAISRPTIDGFVNDYQLTNAERAALER